LQELEPASEREPELPHHLPLHLHLHQRLRLPRHLPQNPPLHPLPRLILRPPYDGDDALSDEVLTTWSSTRLPLRDPRPPSHR
jgi:hypothetical protein